MTTPKFEPSIKALEKVFNNDTDLLLFYLSWLKNGLKAGKAYKELHPEVTDFSANELGSRMLKKVDKESVASAYGLNIEKYFDQLTAGLNAMKRDQFSGEMSEDHKTRKDYHDKLGRLLGLEDRIGNQTNIAVAVQNITYGPEDMLDESFDVLKEEISKGRLTVEEIIEKLK